MLAALAGQDPKNYKTFFRDATCFYQDSDYFKLNLYPIDFKNTSHDLWAKWAAKTGFATKQEYLEWCHTYRFKALRTWLSTYSPHLVICTGILSVKQFAAAFGAGEETIEDTEAAGKKIRYFLTNHGRTVVAIVYFLGGRYGLTADRQLSATGKKLAELQRSRFG